VGSASRGVYLPFRARGKLPSFVSLNKPAWDRFKTKKPSNPSMAFSNTFSFLIFTYHSFEPTCPVPRLPFEDACFGRSATAKRERLFTFYIAIALFRARCLDSPLRMHILVARQPLIRKRYFTNYIAIPLFRARCLDSPLRMHILVARQPQNENAYSRFILLLHYFVPGASTRSSRLCRDSLARQPLIRKRYFTNYNVITLFRARRGT
jgi:hypothetical protein